MSRIINKTYIYYNHCCDSCKPITVDVYLLTKHIYFLKSYKRNSQETDQLLPHGSLSHYKYFTSFLIFFSSLHSPCHLRLFFFALCWICSFLQVPFPAQRHRGTAAWIQKPLLRRVTVKLSIVETKVPICFCFPFQRIKLRGTENWKRKKKLGGTFKPAIFTSAVIYASTILHCTVGYVVKLMVWETHPSELLCFEMRS